MKKPERLVKLLVVLTIATLLACLAGITEKIPWKKTLKCYVKTAFRKGLQVFQHLSAKGIERVAKALLKLLRKAHHLVSLEK